MQALVLKRYCVFVDLLKSNGLLFDFLRRVFWLAECHRSFVSSRALNNVNVSIRAKASRFTASLCSSLSRCFTASSSDPIIISHVGRRSQLSQPGAIGYIRGSGMIVLRSLFIEIDPH